MNNKEIPEASNYYSLYYILDENNNPVPLPNTDEGFKKYMEFRADYKRRNIRTTHENGYDIHSVFLGQNTTPGAFGRPKLFGTAIKRTSDGDFIEEWEYDTIQECLDGHNKADEMAREGKFDTKDKAK